MRTLLPIAILLIILVGCQSKKKTAPKVISSDIDRFWVAFDSISGESDSMKQIRLLEDLYLSKGTPGLYGLIDAKGYEAVEFIDMMKNYPKFLNSVRPNTYQSQSLSAELEEGIAKLKALYQDLRPAKIYFTMGAMRSGGTTMDSLVLISSELAMADDKTDISEFQGRQKSWAENYFAANPLEDVVLLNIHEYVHTQQNKIPTSLLYQCLYEGVAEFVSVKAMGIPSSTPAVAYGKGNPKVREVFEREMFFERESQWLWSNAPNQFEVRDLGYYIGYQICEQYYDQAEEKKAAIKEMIELDYTNPKQVEAFIDKSNFFTKPIQTLRSEDEERRPKVIRVKQFENGSQEVNPNLEEITIEFTETLDGYHTSVDYGDLGEDAFPKVTDRIWAQDSLSWTMKVELESNKKYQILIYNNFRSKDGMPLMPYLIEFKTRE